MWRFFCLLYLLRAALEIFFIYMMNKIANKTKCSRKDYQMILTELEMSRLVGKPTMWFPNRSNTKRSVQA